MITINLLPHELRPVKRTPLPYFIVLGIAVLAGLFCAKTYMTDVADLETINVTLKMNQDDLETHQENIEKYKMLVAKKKHLAVKLTTINEIASDRLIWSYHLYTLSRLAPDNLWYESIEEGSRTITVNTQVMDQKTKKMVTKKSTRRVPVLKLKGCVSVDDLGRTDITPFLTVLDTDEEFIKMFQMESPTLNYKKVGKDKVRTFTLDCVIGRRTGGSE